MKNNKLSDFDPMVKKSLDKAQTIVREKDSYDNTFDKVHRKITMNIPIHRLRRYYTAFLLSELAEKIQKQELEKLYKTLSL